MPDDGVEGAAAASEVVANTTHIMMVVRVQILSR